MNWHIGQEVVALATDKVGVKKDVIYTITALRAGMCSCCAVNIDVGFCLTQNALIRCAECGITNTEYGGPRWYAPKWFAPLQTASEEADMKEAIEESLCQPAPL